MLSYVRDALDSGDPVFRSWPLVDSYYLPISLCVLYVFFVKKLGPDFMQKRKPFDLRGVMIVYNFTIVAIYVACLLTIIYSMLTSISFKYLCTLSIHTPKMYTVLTATWVFYCLKYVEFADTVFFILRKKEYLITNLHLIHHAVVPFFCWIGIRMEKTGFQIILLSINGFVHVIMYTYYGLSAMGPEMQKVLWWKKHLTMLQMIQFVAILSLTLLAPSMLGCKTTPYCVFIDTFLGTIFLILFGNFYIKTYQKAAAKRNKEQKVAEKNN